MSDRHLHKEESRAARAFSLQAPQFDALYEKDGIIRYKRNRLRAHLESLVSSGRLLELNCGTGNDAVYFASRGYAVHASDLSEGMLEELRRKQQLQPQLPLTTESCSYLHLDRLEARGPYDAVYSNFGGLNCTPDLDQVLRSIHPLLKEGGVVTLVLISKFCLWETALLFRGKFRTAFRRFFASGGRAAKVEGAPFRCWYYSPRQVRKMSEGWYELLEVEGLCSLVPPSYLEGFADKYPRAFRWLARQEDRWKARWPWRSMGDYVIVTLRKAAGTEHADESGVGSQESGVRSRYGHI